MTGGMYLKGVTEHNHGHLLSNRATLAREDKEAYFKEEEEEEEEEKPEVEEEEEEGRPGSSLSIRKEDEGGSSRPVTPEIESGWLTTIVLITSGNSCAT